jgi:hypothetical protein
MLRLVHVFAVLLAVAQIGCTPECLQSSDIQVTVVPDPGIDPTLIARLHVALSVNGSQAKTITIVPQQVLGSTGSAFILHPTAAPSRATYNVTVTIEAFDESNNLIAIGSDSEQVLSKGCNRLTAHLAGLPGMMMGGDMAQPPGSDLSLMPPRSDLGGCFGAMPDEDNDGRANACDACPADYDPTPSDSDGDGLPDACDPDPTKAGNKLIYFDPFDTASGHWSGTFTVGMSAMQVDVPMPNPPPYGTVINIANTVDSPPLGVRVQTFALAPFYYVQTGTPTLANVDIFLGDNTNPTAPNANGVLCQIRLDDQHGDSIRVRAVVNGNLMTFNETPPTANCRQTSTLPPPPMFCFQTNTLYRMRLTQRGNQYTCEVLDDAGNMYAPAALTATPPAGPTQVIVLQETDAQVQFRSVVAETALP